MNGGYKMHDVSVQKNTMPIILSVLFALICLFALAVPQAVPVLGTWTAFLPFDKRAIVLFIVWFVVSAIAYKGLRVREPEEEVTTTGKKERVPGQEI